MRKRALGLAVALVVGAFVVSASGAATTTAQKVTRIDVSTRASVVHYLRSIHVNAKHAVIQRGLRNYAGARCPGKHWTCSSTKHTVVQIAKQGGQNRFACKSSKCVVVQVSGTAHGVYLSSRQVASASAPSKPGGNSGVCIKTGSGATTGTGQSCVIQQVGSGPNVAGIYENTMKVSGVTQLAQYTAQITQQSSGSNKNQACVTQVINLDGSASNANGKPTAVNLRAHQSVVITQDASGSGNNTANQAANSDGSCASGAVAPATAPGLLQSQILTSSVNANGPISQNLDRNDSGAVDTSNFPCPHVPTIDLPANLCIDIEQNQGAAFSTGSGSNGAAFWQENDLYALANTTAAANGSITQIQGAQAKGVGGLWANVNQQSSGTSTFTSNQNEIQCEDAFKNQTLPTPTNPALCDTGTSGNPDTDPPAGVTVNQSQYGPAGMGSPAKNGNGPVHYYHGGKDPDTSSQTGNANNTYQINQNTTQSNDKNTIQKNFLIGGLNSSGNGTVTQNALIQGNGKEDVQAGTGPVSGQIDCSGSTSASCTKTLAVPNVTQSPTDPSVYGSGLRFEFSNVDPTVTFLCSLDGGTFVACSHVQNNAHSTTGYETTSNLQSGKHTFQVETEDPDNSKVSDPTTLFTWWITPPDPSITSSAPPSPDFSGNSYTFTWTDNDNTVQYQCSINGGTASTCSSGKTYSNLPAGSTTFTVTAYGANDSGFTHPDTTPPTVSWTILPISVSAFGSTGLTSDAAIGTDGSSAGWECQAGGPIALTVGTTPYPPGTFAEITMDAAAGVSISGLAEPTFTTDYNAQGSPRFYILLSNGDYMFGYEPGEGWGTSSHWDLYEPLPDPDHPTLVASGSWSDVVSFELSSRDPNSSITEADVIADGGQGFNTTANVSDLTFKGHDYNPGTCP